MFGLNNNITSNSNNNQLKGASIIPDNIPVCYKTKSLINIKNMFGLI